MIGLEKFNRLAPLDLGEPLGNKRSEDRAREQAVTLEGTRESLTTLQQEETDAGRAFREVSKRRDNHQS